MVDKNVGPDPALGIIPYKACTSISSDKMKILRIEETVVIR
jgi:hypothetical protein